MHTSTVTVAVINSTSGSETNLWSKDDFEYRWFSGTGKGGQKRNKSMSCLEITHKPTGITQLANGRSRVINEQTAMDALKQKLDSISIDNNHNKVNDNRAKQIGSGQKSDKRRTYRFKDDAVVDHITGKTTSIRQFMKGSIEQLW